MCCVTVGWSLSLSGLQNGSKLFQKPKGHVFIASPHAPRPVTRPVGSLSQPVVMLCTPPICNHPGLGRHHLRPGFPASFLHTEARGVLITQSDHISPLLKAHSGCLSHLEINPKSFAGPCPLWPPRPSPPSWHPCSLTAHRVPTSLPPRSALMLLPLMSRLFPQFSAYPLALCHPRISAHLSPPRRSLPSLK